MKPLFFATLLVASTASAQRIPWQFETTPIPSNLAGDPAFVFVPTPMPQGTSFIIGTDTTNPGLYVWPPTAGAFPTVFPGGIFNSVDARGSLVVAVSNITSTVAVFVVVDGALVQLDTSGFNVNTPRHVALRQTAAGQFEMIVDTSSTVVERYQLIFLSGGRVGFTTLPSVTVSEPPSGLAVDDRTGQIYIAQPSIGVIVVTPPMPPRLLVSIDAGQLGSAVGGVDLYLAADGGAFVLTTAPNEGTVNVHAKDGGFLAELQFGDGGAVLRPEHLDVFEPGTPEFPRGVLILEDSLMANYKVVSLQSVETVFPLPEPFILNPVAIDAGVRPDAGMRPDGGLDAGVSDAGAGVDAGPGSDAGMGDGGSTGGGAGGGAGGTGGGSGGTGGGSGTPAGPAPGVEPMNSCGCAGNPFALLPALLSLWFVRRRRPAP